MLAKIVIWIWIIAIGIPMMIIMAGLGYGGVMEFLKWINT